MIETPAVYDIETRNWDRFRCAVTIESDGAASHHWTLDSLQTWAKKHRGPAFAHAGGRFDLFFLPRPHSVVLASSGILRARRGRATFKDSLYLMPMSLAKIGRAIGVEKSAASGAAADGMTDREVIAYCEQDCRVLRAALGQFSEWIDPYLGDRTMPGTAGGAAAIVAGELEPEGVARLASEIPDLDEWLDRAGYVVGGRVETWGLGHWQKPVWVYDLRSSYPASWGEGDLPAGGWRRVEGDEGGRFGLYRCKVSQPRKRLPVVMGDWKWRHKGATAITREELQELRNMGARVKIAEGWETDEGVSFGSNFARAMYAEKRRGSPWAKLVINSLHGKTSQRLIMDEWTWNKKTNAWDQFWTLAAPAWYQRPGIGAYVLARARIRLWKGLEAVRAKGFTVLYCDTDSIHTDCPPEQFPGDLSRGMGAWGIEAEGAGAYYLGPKMYAIHDRAGKALKMALKGIKGDNQTIELAQRVARGESVPVTFDAGLQLFRSLKNEAWSPRKVQRTRTVRLQTGGKAGPFPRGRAAKWIPLDYPRG